MAETGERGEEQENADDAKPVVAGMIILSYQKHQRQQSVPLSVATHNLIIKQIISLI